MVDQKLFAIHNILFLVEQLYIPLVLINWQLLDKVSSLDFDYFSSQVLFFDIFCRRLQKHLSKLKSLNVYII